MVKRSASEKAYVISSLPLWTRVERTSAWIGRQKSERFWHQGSPSTDHGPPMSRSRGASLAKEWLSIAVVPGRPAGVIGSWPA